MVVAIYQSGLFRSHTLAVRNCKVFANGGSIAFEIILAKGPVVGSVSLDVCTAVASGGSVAVEIIIFPAVGFGKAAEGPVGLCCGRGPSEKKNHGSCQM